MSEQIIRTRACPDLSRTESRELRRRGGQKGNQNARKHGFYSRALLKSEKYAVKRAAMVEGIDDEIAVLRVKIKSILKHDPGNIKLYMQALASLARLIRTKHSIPESKQDSLKAAIENVIRDVAVSLGVAFIRKE